MELGAKKAVLTVEYSEFVSFTVIYDITYDT